MFYGKVQVSSIGRGKMIEEKKKKKNLPPKVSTYQINQRRKEYQESGVQHTLSEISRAFETRAKHWVFLDHSFYFLSARIC